MVEHTYPIQTLDRLDFDGFGRICPYGVKLLACLYPVSDSSHFDIGSFSAGTDATDTDSHGEW
jgi:hypothetical protein